MGLIRRIEGAAMVGVLAATAAACGSSTPTPEIRYLPATPGTTAAAGQASPDALSTTIAMPSASARSEVAQPVSCEKAEQIVWAPVSIGNREIPIDFEVDGTEHASLTLVNFWSPGVTPANHEYWMLFGDSNLNLSGLNVDADGHQAPPVEPRRIGFEGAGSDWRWNTDVSQGGCGGDELVREINDHYARRTSEGVTVEWVTPQQLNALFPGAARALQGDGVSR